MNDLLYPEVLAALQKHDIQFEVLECDPDLADTAAFCEHYRYTLQQAANTILVASKKVEPTKYAVCVVLGTTKLDVNKAVCKLMGIKRASFASGEETKELTDMLIGGVTAVGIEDLPIYVDQAVMNQEKVIMGGGNRSSKLLLDPEELKKLPNVQVVADLAREKE